MTRSEHDTRLAQLERERAELVASLPKHSVPAATLIRIEDLDEEIAALRSAALRGVSPAAAQPTVTPPENVAPPPDHA